MNRAFLGIAALALVLVATETASAGPRIGVSVGGGNRYYGGYGPGIGVNYGTRVGSNGYLNLNYSSGYSYPAYGYARPAYYTGPVYGSPYYYNAVPRYYAQPVYGYSYSYRSWSR